MNARLALTPAFILHRKPFSDTSLLIELFSLHDGRLTCIAKGVKNSKLNKAAILQPFTPLVISFSGNGEVKTLRTYEAVDNTIPLLRDQLYSAYYINELLLKLLQKHEPHEAVFAAYAQILQNLQDDPENTERFLRHFELQLLSEIGYGLMLSHDASSNEPIQPDKHYLYRAEYGPVELKLQNSSPNTGQVVSGATLLALNTSRLTDDIHFKESKLLMRSVISHLLGGYNFKSREFFTNRF